MITKTNQETIESASLFYKRKKYKITNLNIQCFSGFKAEFKFIGKKRWVLLHGHNNLNYAKKVTE